MELIGTKLRKAEKSNEYACFEELYCKNPHKCPILERGKCIHQTILEKCIYGKSEFIKSGSTKRGKAYDTFVKEKQKQIDNNEFPKMPKGEYNNCLAKIGDYYYLPYSHMNNVSTRFGDNKIPFLKGTIISLLKFSPTGIFLSTKQVTPLYMFLRLDRSI